MADRLGLMQRVENKMIAYLNIQMKRKGFNDSLYKRYKNSLVKPELSKKLTSFAEKKVIEVFTSMLDNEELNFEDKNIDNYDIEKIVYHVHFHIFKHVSVIKHISIPDKPLTNIEYISLNALFGELEKQYKRKNKIKKN